MVYENHKKWHDVIWNAILTKKREEKWRIVERVGIGRGREGEVNWREVAGSRERVASREHSALKARKRHISLKLPTDAILTAKRNICARKTLYGKNEISALGIF